jgi:hypothetical protein
MPFDLTPSEPVDTGHVDVEMFSDLSKFFSHQNSQAYGSHLPLQYSFHPRIAN